MTGSFALFASACFALASLSARPEATGLRPAAAATAEAPAGPEGAPDGGETSGGDAPTPAPSGGIDEEIDALIGPVISERMVVTGARVEQELRDAPVSLSVVTAEDIRDAPADNYADLFRGLPGVTALQTSARGYNIGVRGGTGLDGNTVLALVDGRSINAAYSGGIYYDALTIDPDEIAQVEIQRGPGSAVWGANALTGVVNFRTKSPKEMLGGRVAAYAGEQDTRGISFRWADARGDTSYKVSSSFFEQDAWDRSQTFPDGTPYPEGFAFPNEGARQLKTDVRVDHESSPGHVWSGRLGYQQTRGIVHTPAGPFTVDPGAWEGNAALHYDGPSLAAKLYWNRSRVTSTSIFTGRSERFDYDTAVAEAVAHRVLGERNLLVYGGTARLESFDLSVAPDEDARTDAGLFVEDQLEVNRKLALHFGVRFDDFETAGSTVSPRFAAIVRPTPRHGIRFAYNQAYRAPTLIHNFVDTQSVFSVELAPGMPFFVPLGIVGNEDLDVEGADVFELAYTAELGERVFLTAAAYLSTLQDRVELLPSEFYSSADPPPGWPFDPSLVPAGTIPKTVQYQNVGEVEQQGFELSVDAAWRRFGLRGAYTYLDAPKVSKSPTTAINIPPKHQVSLSGHWVADAWRAMVGVTWVDDTFWTDVFDERFHRWTDDYLLVGGSFTRSFRGGAHELAVSVTNLLDEDVQQHVFGDVIGRKLTVEYRAFF